MSKYQVTFKESPVDFEWRQCPLKGFQDLEVSDVGYIRTVESKKPIDPNEDGLIKHRKNEIDFRVLILLTWEGPPVVLYLDGDPTNDNHLNLCWASEKMLDPVATGMRAKHPMARLSRAQAVSVMRRKFGKGVTADDVALEFGISRWTVHAIWQGKRWADVHQQILEEMEKI